MQLPDKNKHRQTFENGMDSDISPEDIASNTARFMLNCRPYTLGDKGVITNLPGNTLIQNSLPAGNNVAIGWGKNEETGKVYLFIYNDQNNHGIYAYDQLTSAITPVIRNLIDTNNVDILKFRTDYLINHVDVVSDKLIYWVDGFNKARKFNINKAIDKTPSGYGGVITEDFITAYKQTGIFPPAVTYFTDLTRTSNYLYALQFKFAYVFRYDDGEISNVSDYSAVPLPSNESYLGASSITFNNNCIVVSLETGSKLVTKIEILVKINSAEFVSCIILNKSQLLISDNSVYKYNFYNDGSYTPYDPLKVARPYSFLPRVPYVQAFVKVAMTYGNFTEGFATVQITGSVVNTFIPFYLPSGTVSQLNNALFTAEIVGEPSSHGGLFNTWWTVTYHFEVGHDVKKGNDFKITYTGGNTSALVGQQPTLASPYDYVATISDSALTVSGYIKQYLRTLDAVATGVVSNESTDSDGNVSWDFTIEAHEGQQPFNFSTSVQPVNYSTLLDNGLSINTIKQGASRKYGVVYEDDDGRTSLTYTVDSLLINTPFETEVLLGQTTPIGLQQPIHTVTITNQPPLWAKYWRLVRTSDTNTFLQILIQQVNSVTVANEATYLDLVVGSLFTYQKIHPDTILKYDFERGDRLRLISNENTVPPTFYTPFFETEVLSYSVTTTEFVNANITIDGSAEVTPDRAVDPNYIGKYIVINDIERLITGIDGSKYVLDYPIVANLNYQSGTPSTTTYPNYTFVDRRGIIRIKKPPSTYNVVNQSLVEIYRPQSNLNDQNYLNFYDFQQKFAVSNWGTPLAAHMGNIQNQDGANPIATPVIVKVTNGDAYVRNRELPSNNQDPNPQVIIDQICDPNFSDFYQSNLYNLGRVYPQDQGIGVVEFTQRERFSNNYIQDTQINGLNDFDNNDRKDYNDQYGAITLSKFRNGVLHLFKRLKHTWTPVNRNIIIDNSTSSILGTTKELLNDLQYSTIDGGIGNNGESWMESNGYMYAAYANEGVFVRIADDGTIPISSVYFYDKRSRELLNNVSKHNLRIFGGFDKLNSEALWTIQDFVNYIFNNAFNSGDWQTITDAYPYGTTFAVTQQPAHSTATVVGGIIQITGTNTLGDDYFLYQGTLPDGAGVTLIMKFCFTVTPPPVRPIYFSVRASSLYCVQQGDPTPPPGDSSITINNNMETLLVTHVEAVGDGGDFDYTGIEPSTSQEHDIPAGSYTVSVRTDHGSAGTLTITSNGTPTSYSFTTSGISQTQYEVQTPIVIDVDPTD